MITVPGSAASVQHKSCLNTRLASFTKHNVIQSCWSRWSLLLFWKCSISPLLPPKPTTTLLLFWKFSGSDEVIQPDLGSSSLWPVCVLTELIWGAAVAESEGIRYPWAHKCVSLGLTQHPPAPAVSHCNLELLTDADYLYVSQIDVGVRTELSNISWQDSCQKKRNTNWLKQHAHINEISDDFLMCWALRSNSPGYIT